MSKIIYVGKLENPEEVFEKYEDKVVYNHTNLELSEIADYIQTVPFLADDRAVVVFGGELIKANDRKKLLAIDVPEWSNLILLYEGKESAIAADIKSSGAKVIKVGPPPVVTKKVMFLLVDMIFDGELYNSLNLYNRIADSSDFSSVAIMAFIGRKLKVLCLASDNNYQCAVDNYKLPKYLWNKTKANANRIGKPRLSLLLKQWAESTEGIRRNWRSDSLYVERMLVSIAGGV